VSGEELYYITSLIEGEGVMGKQLHLHRRCGRVTTKLTLFMVQISPLSGL